MDSNLKLAEHKLFFHRCGPRHVHSRLEAKRVNLDLREILTPSQGVRVCIENQNNAQFQYVRPFDAFACKPSSLGRRNLE
jgi:hypothetical protein